MAGWRKQVVVFINLLVCLGCSFANVVDPENAAQGGCSLSDARKTGRLCYSALVEVGQDSRRKGIHEQKTFCCCLNGLEACLTSAFNHYGCSSVTEIEGEIVDLISEALDTGNLHLEGNCRGFDDATCQPQLRPFQKVTTEIDALPVIQVPTSPRQLRMENLESDNHASTFNTIPLDLRQNTSIWKEVLTENVTGPFSLDSDPKGLLVMITKPTGKVFIISAQDLYDGKVQTDDLTFNIISELGLSKEKSADLLSKYEDYDSSSASNTGKRQSRFSWLDMFNASSPSDFLKALNESVYRAMSDWNVPTKRSLDLNGTDLELQPNQNESWFRTPDFDILYVFPVTAESSEDYIRNSRAFKVLSTNDSGNSTRLNSSEEVSRSGRVATEVAALPPFNEDSSTVNMTESPNLFVEFLGFWPTENRLSRTFSSNDTEANHTEENEVFRQIRLYTIPDERHLQIEAENSATNGNLSTEVRSTGSELLILETPNVTNTTGLRQEREFTHSANETSAENSIPYADFTQASLTNSSENRQARFDQGSVNVDTTNETSTRNETVLRALANSFPYELNGTNVSNWTSETKRLARFHLHESREDNYVLNSSISENTGNITNSRETRFLFSFANATEVAQNLATAAGFQATTNGTEPLANSSVYLRDGRADLVQTSDSSPVFINETGHSNVFHVFPELSLNDTRNPMELFSAENSNSTIKSSENETLLSRPGRVLNEIAVLPPFKEDPFMVDITESPNVLVNFIGSWDTTNRSSRTRPFGNEETEAEFEVESENFTETEENFRHMRLVFDLIEPATEGNSSTNSIPRTGDRASEARSLESTPTNVTNTTEVLKAHWTNEREIRHWFGNFSSNEETANETNARHETMILRAFNSTRDELKRANVSWTTFGNTSGETPLRDTGLLQDLTLETEVLQWNAKR